MNTETTNKQIAGVDEVGRGALAGPVVAAAVILISNSSQKFFDSKVLNSAQRHILYKAIKSKELVGVGACTPAEIESHNIHKASLLAMTRALARLRIVPDLTLVDGKFCPEVNGKIKAVIKGDQKFQCISAASIVAKVVRDYIMVRIGRLYPEYGFHENKGYPTKHHKSALARHGVLSCHRKKYAPILDIINKER